MTTACVRVEEERRGRTRSVHGRAHELTKGGDAPVQELVNVLANDGRDDVEARLDDVAVLGPGEHLEDDLGDAVEGAVR